MKARDSLPWGLGVRRPHLFRVLGAELAERLGVDEADRPEVAFAKVVWQLGRVIDEHPALDERTRRILRITFNLDHDPELTWRRLGERRVVIAQRYGKDHAVDTTTKVLGHARDRYLDRRLHETALTPAPAAAVADLAEAERRYAARWTRDRLGSVDELGPLLAAHTGPDRDGVQRRLLGARLHFLVSADDHLATTAHAEFGPTLCAFTSADLLDDHRAVVRPPASEMHAVAFGRDLLSRLRAYGVGLAVNPSGGHGADFGHHWEFAQLSQPWAWGH